MSQYCDKCQNSIIDETKWLKQIYTDKNCAATAVALRQTTAYHGTGGLPLLIHGLALMKCGLYQNIGTCQNN